MYYSNKFDCHVHSDCSPNGTDSIMLLSEYAIQRNLSGFAVTNTCDCDRYVEMQYSKRLFESVYSVYKARDVFKDSLEILNGIEISQPLFNPELTEKIIKNGHYDIVLATIKKLNDGRIISKINYPELSENEISDVFESYLSLILDLSQKSDFDVLSHIILPLRYVDLSLIPFFSLRNFDDIIEEILKNLIEKDRALEINTCSAREKLNSILPPVRIVRMFKELGGKYVTVGSGTHSAHLIGSDISEGLSVIQEAGFDSYCYFKARKPCLINL